MLFDRFVIRVHFLVQGFEPLLDDAVGVDGALATIGDILDLAITVHILKAEVTAAEDIVHQALALFGGDRLAL